MIKFNDQNAFTDLAIKIMRSKETKAIGTSMSVSKAIMSM